MSVPNFVEIGQTDRQTDTHNAHRDHTGDLIICPMLCCSNWTDYNCI